MEGGRLAGVLATARKRVAQARNISWAVGNPGPIALTVDLDRGLPLPSLQSVTVRWPNRSAWSPGQWRIDLVRAELEPLVRVEEYDIAAREPTWHRHGGFPVAQADSNFLGQPGYPKHPYDIRGEVFEVVIDRRVITAAWDYSDFPTWSREVVDQVDVYFKCLPPKTGRPDNLVSVGYFPRSPRMLARARRAVLSSRRARDIEVYGRFGSWTAGQPVREALVARLRESSLEFTGGFDKRIYPDYLKELARSKVAVDAPGEALISYRLAEAMALGAVVVARTPEIAFPQPLIDGVHYVAMRDDCSDVVERCAALVADADARAKIQANAHRYFDLDFSPQSIARRILRTAVSLARGG
jgi:hypothetical protein